MNKIDRFDGTEYRFLSNFWHSPVEMDGLIYPTVEHAYQAAKCAILGDRKFIQEAKTPAKAKMLGQIVKMVSDWEEIKVDVMRGLLYKKFVAGHSLARQLLATGDAYLEEGNTWGDRFWGTVNGEGKNWLGTLLMEVRESLKNEMS